ncbi:MAG: SDR family oxidoreductase [Chlamydiales bacterium]|nr:SDR family oxidoreductase [Chlamydiales bacterium]MBY0462562.1 SDR family oxidoreductase [Alphaproteobacteria bacterium]
MSKLERKTIVITGGSRGIGLAIALRYATTKANLIILTKDAPENIKQTADQIISAGGQALVLNIDISDQQAIKEAISQGVDLFGGVNILVNNMSAMSFTDTLHTTPEQFDLIITTSVRAAFFMSQACFPYLRKANNPHIVNISPPLHIDRDRLKNHLAFSVSKYAMSFCTLGMSAEFESDGIAVNSLWPETPIATSTIKEHCLAQVYVGSRWPAIMADAVYELTLRDSKKCSGQFFTDEALLREKDIIDFSHYAVDLSAPLMQSLFLPADENKTPISQELFLCNRAPQAKNM